MNTQQKHFQLFQQADLDIQLDSVKKVSKKHLINSLNYINFNDGTILINFKHSRYDNIISIPARPQPCLGDTLDCIWIKKRGLNKNLSSYTFLNFHITDGKKLILVKADVKKISEDGISFILPEVSYDISSRKVRRYSCDNIQVELIQNSVSFNGDLLYFNAFSFGVEISVLPPQTFQWLTVESAIHVIFKHRQNILYSGECMIIGQTDGKKTRIFALKPIHDQMRRFKPKVCRSARHKLLPSPNAIFKHPFTQKRVNLEVEELSGSGFSVEEYYEEAVLLPGMIIPELLLEFANNFAITCKAQVINRKVLEDSEKRHRVKCGIAILDMDIQDQARLSSVLHQSRNRKSYVCHKVDLDMLFEFFFKTGTIYPQRYAFIHANKEKYKETYEKLYIQSPTIARHFIYQDKGVIQGHISMLRFYENTWLIHKLASSSVYSKAGLVVLSQLGSYVNDFYGLCSTHMDFLICYFRPTTKFSNRVFGGFTRELNKPKGCSLDSFAFFRFIKGALECQGFTESWVLKRTQPEDLSELKNFYEYISGGLMLSALDLQQDKIHSDELNREYQRLGFKRERHIFSLKKEEDLKAVIIVAISDIGLDMSNLTNCIHVIVLDSNDLPRNVLYASLSQISQYYEQEEIPVLIYPTSYPESQLIPSEKMYHFWVLDIPQAGDQYLKYMENLLTHPRHE